MTSFSLRIIVPITNTHFETNILLRLLVSSPLNKLEKYDPTVSTVTLTVINSI